MTALGASLRLATVGLVIIAALAGVDRLTHARIVGAEQRATARLYVELTGDERIGHVAGRLTPPMHICTPAGAWVLSVYRATAKGYAGMIQLLVGVDAAGTVTGVRTIQHRETRGIGDVIDLRRSDWIRGFDGSTAASLTAAESRVHVVSGASITTSAVIDAVHSALEGAAAAPSRGCSHVFDR